MEFPTQVKNDEGSGGQCEEKTDNRLRNFLASDIISVSGDADDEVANRVKQINQRVVFFLRGPLLVTKQNFL